MRFDVCKNPAFMQSACARKAIPLFSIISTEDENTISFSNTKFGFSAKDIMYQVNNGEFQQLTESTTISLNANDVLSFRNKTKNNLGASQVSLLSTTKKFIAVGDLASMYYPNGMPNSAFKNAFEETKIVSSSGLILPNVVTDSCYEGMFRYCESLTDSPQLPATKLASKCYKDMFTSSSISIVPELPATELAPSCYEAMFNGCQNVKSSPELPALTMQESCYSRMFMASGLEVAPQLPATELAPSCYSYMFGTCRITESPILPAKTLVANCYEGLFYALSGIVTKVTCLATNISATKCVDKWLPAAPASGVFVKAQGISWPSGESGIPDGWTVQDYAG